MMHKIIVGILLVPVVIISSIYPNVEAQSLSGTTGLFNIPNARTQPDKTLLIGVHQLPVEYSLYGSDRSHGPGPHDNRYGYASITFLPRVEMMFRYTYMLNADRGPDITLFMDRMVAGRLLLLKESRNLPAVLIGIHDPVSPGSNEWDKWFGANYVVSSKALKFDNLIFDTSIGYAFDLLNQKTQVYKGLFGGVSLTLEEYSWLEWMLEHDSNRFNTAAKIQILGRVQVMAGLMEFKRPAGGISYRFQF